MHSTSIPEVDKDYIILNEIEAQQDVSQRELSRKTGLSLGSVNLLLQKMIREGLIKMETIPANRVIYMLTPKGIAEKAAKTVRYVKHHYNAIQNTQEAIWRKLDQYEGKFVQIFICLPGSELDDLIVKVVEDFIQRKHNQHVTLIGRNELDAMDAARKLEESIVLFMPDELVYKDKMISYKPQTRSCQVDTLI